MTDHSAAAATAKNSSTLNHSLVRTHGFEELEIEGTLPSDLQGTLYRTGPGSPAFA